MTTDRLSAPGENGTGPGAVSAAHRAAKGGGDGRCFEGNRPVRAGVLQPEEAAK